MSDSDGGRFGATCPRCDEPVEGEETACPECGLQYLDGEGGLSQDAIDAMLEEADVSPPEDLSPDRIGTPLSVRVFVALAITVPMGPVVTLVAVSVVPLEGFGAALVFLATWTTSAYVLARSPVPTTIVANGLVLLGATMATAPIVIAVGRAVVGTDAADVGALGSNVAALQGVFLAIGLGIVAVAVVVRRHALATESRWEGRPPGR